LVQTDTDEIGPYFIKKDISLMDREEIPGMNAESILTDNTSGKTIALGSRTPGTRAPTAALFQLFPGNKKHSISTTWVSSVTSLNPLTVEEGAPDRAAAGVGRVVVGYEIKGPKDGARLSCLDETTGQILWDVPIPRSDTGSVGGITVSNHHVFVAHWTYLDIFQLLDGAHKLTIGVW
jgi:outer membrane protein assembly factor BamB